MNLDSMLLSKSELPLKTHCRTVMDVVQTTAAATRLGYRACDIKTGAYKAQQAGEFATGGRSC